MNNNAWPVYAQLKNDFLKKNPGATHEEVERYCQTQARRLGL